MLVIFMLVIGLPLVILVFTSLLPFYEALRRMPSAASRRQLSRPVRSRIVSRFDRQHAGARWATATVVVPFTALCAWLAVRRHPGAWLLDQLARLPLVFPAIVMSVAFLYVFVNLPIPLYGTLLSVIIASTVALPALRHALCLCRASCRFTMNWKMPRCRRALAGRVLSCAS